MFRNMEKLNLGEINKNIYNKYYLTELILNFKYPFLPLIIYFQLHLVIPSYRILNLQPL